MASIKVKFRPSSIGGKEGSIYYQLIHNRVVRHIRTDYRIFESEWNDKVSMVEIPKTLSVDRKVQLQQIIRKVLHDIQRLEAIIQELCHKGFCSTDIMVNRF